MLAGLKLVARSGIASDVSPIRTPDRPGSSGAVFTEVRLELAGTPVLSRTHAYLDAADGDELMVVGFFHGKELWSIAWYNRTRKRGYEPSGWFFWPSIVLSACCLAASFGVIFLARRFDWRALVLVPVSLMIATQAISAFYHQRAGELIRAYRSEQSAPR